MADIGIIEPVLANRVAQAPKLKDFVFERRLGSGSYASVYKAHSKRSPNVHYAIKCIKKSSLNRTSTDNLLREIEILKHIRHPYIAQLHDFHWDDVFIYLVLEYCAGGDLSHFIKARRTLPERYARRFVQQIACALKHLYELGITHMDLKPQNILLASVDDTIPILKLGDFGFAQYMEDNGGIGYSLRGSPLYMAPEILKHKSYDAKVDLWSVGVILHEVLFGYAPFVSNSMAELEKKILDNSPIQIPTNGPPISENCRDLLHRLLQRNPRDRISFEAFFAHKFVDLEHMPAANSYPKALELLRKATYYDERLKDFKRARNLYLNAIEYLLAAIQYEKNHEKKKEFRMITRCYLKRAEELDDDKKLSTLIATRKVASLSAPPQSQTTTNNTASILTPKMDMLSIDSTSSCNSGVLSGTSSTMTMSSSPSNISIKTIDELLHLVLLEYNNIQCQDAWTAVRKCSQTDEKLKLSILNSNAEDLHMYFNTYQESLDVLFSFLPTLSKDGELYKSLKFYIKQWISKAEELKVQLNNKNLEQQAASSLPASLPSVPAPPSDASLITSVVEIPIIHEKEHMNEMKQKLQTDANEQAEEEDRQFNKNCRVS